MTTSISLTVVTSRILGGLNTVKDLLAIFRVFVKDALVLDVIPHRRPWNPSIVRDLADRCLPSFQAEVFDVL